MDSLLHRRITRRTLLRTGAGAAAGALAASIDPLGLRRALAAPRRCGSLTDIEHVVILIQENRSFDHYFGTHPGVRGFADPHALRQADGSTVFAQPNPANTTDPPLDRLLPFHLDTAALPPNPNGTCTEDITHSWGAQHACWNGGRMDGFAQVHLRADDPYGAATMGYYTREDVPFHRAVADAFTICDGYHCSVLGPTDPNRLYAMSASIDPDGKHGGPVLSNPSYQGGAGRFTWTTYPERLQAAGVSWKQYLDPELNATSSNVLYLFAAYQDATSELFQRGILPTFPGDFARDVLAGELPQVSWLQLDDATSDHPPDPPGFGEDALHHVLTILTANPDVWAKTLLLVTWDENGGFFDHVVPPTSAPGTAGEWLTTGAQPAGPIGLGFRVPMLVISPFSRGGLVCSDTLDHTSTLLFLERRFGVEVPNLSAWRRQAVGDLTGALDLATPPDATPPSLPPTVTRDAPVAAACVQDGAPLNLVGATPSPYPVPSPQSMPVQEPGRPRRPSGACERAEPGRMR